MNLVALLLSLLASVHAPAPVVVVQVPELVQEVPEVPVLPEHAATVPEPAPVAVSSPPAPAPCAAGEEWQDGFGCVAVQLPEETAGRAYG